MNNFKVSLKNGFMLPQLGIGTHGIYNQDVMTIISEAINFGYQLIDTATAYNNHKEIGNVIKNYRRQVILCTKINENDIHENKITNIWYKLTEDLQTDFIDILLLHSPFYNFKKYLKQLIHLKKLNYIKNLGVSNFSITHLEEIKDFHSFIDINQIEFHPYLNDTNLLNYCKEKKIHVMAYRPFAKSYINEDTDLHEIAKLNQKTIYQIALRWLIDKEITAIPGTRQLAHLKENFDIFNFSLSEQEIKRIDSFKKMIRTCARNNDLFK